MSNEQLREALRETLLFCETFSNRWDGETGAHPFDMVERARQALATTEPAVTKDALMAGRAYAQEALIRFDDAYDRHPSTEPERNAILEDIRVITEALATATQAEPAVPQGERVSIDREQAESWLSAMERVIDVADRKTDEFDSLRKSIIDLTLLLHATPSRHAAHQDMRLVPLSLLQELESSMHALGQGLDFTSVDSDRYSRLREVITATPATPAAPSQEPALHIGACITDGVLHATVMRREANGHVTILAKAEMDAKSLLERDCLAEMSRATPSQPAVPSRLLQKLDASIAWLESGEVLPGTSACIGLNDIKTIRATLAAAPSQPVTDEVFAALELDPEAFRTEGGAVNAGKLKAAILHPYNYLPPDHWLQARFSKPGGRPLATDQATLTDEEIDKIADEYEDPCGRIRVDQVFPFSRAIIAALREKE